ncbi:Precorrin-8X methylmutase [uncultured Gammaproteobacteria bacterium]
MASWTLKEFCPVFDYLRDPVQIYRRSFELIEQETDLSAVPADLRDVAIRIVHATVQPAVIADLVWTADFVTAAKRALAAGAPILADTRMVSDGIIARRLVASNPIVCTLYEPQTAEVAKTIGNTRSAAAVDLWGERLAGAVVAIGNAPTALFRLLERLREGAPRPAAILGFPIGFVGAAESKQALIDADLGIPYITLRGRIGGSAVAAAALNALGAEPA